jgi:aspartate racemase
MKTAGMIGGIGPESTIAYYRAIIDAYRRRTGDGSYPSLLIDSIDVTKLLGLAGAGRLDELARYLLREIERLAAAGADFGFLAANTPHVVFDELRAAAPIPLISIVEATAAKAAELGLKRPALLGTRFTMDGTFYRDAFSRAGIALVVPDEGERAYVHDKYVSELVNGLTLDETRRCVLAIVARLHDRENADGLILGGTELPLLLPDAAYAGVPVLDTTLIHADSVVAALLA